MKQKVRKKLQNLKKYYRENGFGKFLKHLAAKLLKLEERQYQQWRNAHCPTEQELQRQRAQRFEHETVFSILVPLYRTPEHYLKELVESVRKQSYEKWELCFSDGSGQGNMDHAWLEEMMKEDSRIKLSVSEKPLQISENTNQALKLASGEFLVFADHDDLLAPDALYECAKAIDRETETDVLYTDEDKVSMDGKTYFQPHFKSDFNPDLLRSMNYICHLFVVRKTLQEKVGGLDPAYNGAQDYDFVLRCTEKARIICHIPKILYHWRAHRDSTSENPESKLYAFEAGKRAVQAHLERCGADADAETGESLGLYRVHYSVKTEPLISIILPSQDHTEALLRCIRSFYEVSGYRNIEILIVENHSKKEKTFEFYEKIQKKHKEVQVVTRKEKENAGVSELYNFGASKASGTYLLFFNRDVEILTPDTLQEMAGYALRDEIGAVGAKVYDADGCICHGGIVLGVYGSAGHAFQGASHHAEGYFSRLFCAQEYSAVSDGILVSKELFDEVGGFDVNMDAAFCEIDLCMKIREQDKLVVYTPYAEFQLRQGTKDSKAPGEAKKSEQWDENSRYFAKKWSKVLQQGDPYYNCNLTLEKSDFSVKNC